MKAIVCVLLFVLSSVTLADTCGDGRYCKDLDLKLPLYDATQDRSVVEITELFSFPESSSSSVTISINCVSYRFIPSRYNDGNMPSGNIVVRAVNPNNWQPGEVLYRIRSGFGIYVSDWYDFDEGFRVVLPPQEPSSATRSFFIGYETEGSYDYHAIILAAPQNYKDTTPIYMTNNRTGTWEVLSKFYSHVGIDSAFVH